MIPTFPRNSTFMDFRQNSLEHILESCQISQESVGISATLEGDPELS